MRFLLALIVVLLAVWYFLPEPEPVAVEDSFIGDQVESLRKAERLEDDYLELDRQRKERLERAAGDGG
jgi:hypothetical protein